MDNAEPHPPRAHTRMIDVGDKPATLRRAVAEGFVRLDAQAARMLERDRGGTRDVLETARLAGIMAGKRTWEVLPLCHPLALDHLAIDFEQRGDRLRIVATAATRAATGVEMEALVTTTYCALALCDLVAPRAPGVRVEGLRLLQKTGGRSGDYAAPAVG